MSEAGSPGQGSRTNNDANQLQFSFPGILSMELGDGLAKVWTSRGNGWTVTLYTDVDPATGAIRDVEDNVRWIVSRRAA